MKFGPPTKVSIRISVEGKDKLRNQRLSGETDEETIFRILKEKGNGDLYDEETH